MDIFNSKDDGSMFSDYNEHGLTKKGDAYAKMQNAQSWNPETHPEGRGNSHLVKNATYDPKKQELKVTYRNGFKAKYRGITEQQYLDFENSDSKGRWALSNLWHLPYTRF